MNNNEDDNDDDSVCNDSLDEKVIESDSDSSCDEANTSESNMDQTLLKSKTFWKSYGDLDASENLSCQPCDIVSVGTGISSVTNYTQKSKQFRSNMSTSSYFESSMNTSILSTQQTHTIKPAGAFKCPIQSCQCSYCTKDQGCCNVCRLYKRRNSIDQCSCYYCGISIGKRLHEEIQKDEKVLNNLKVAYDEFRNLDKHGHYRHVKQILYESIVNAINSSYYQFDFRIGRKVLSEGVQCCKNAFIKFYNTSYSTIDKMIREIKMRQFDEPLKQPSDQNQNYSAKDIYQLESDLCKNYGLFLNDQMRTDVRSKSGPAWEITAAWLDNFFATEAEPQPNRKGERHLHKGGLTKKVIFNEHYVPAMNKIGALYILKYHSFVKVWNRCFPNVKSRKYLAVPSKCVECALIDFEAKSMKCGKGKAELELLCVAHSVKYKGQRAWYHQTRRRGIENPDEIISGITDGCSQSHTAVPHYGSAGCGSIAKSFDIHLQGVMLHGKTFTLYRSFGNVGKGVNVAIHSWLFELEKIVNEKGSLPDTIYMQIDGGPENANATMIGLAELLVHRGVTKRVYITRLPPGHTHEVKSIKLYLFLIINSSLYY